MNFPGFMDDNIGPMNFTEEESIDLDSVENSDISFDEGDSLALIDLELTAAIHGIEKARAIFERDLYNKIIKDSAKRWREEKDFDPVMLSSRGISPTHRGEFSDSFYDSLPKVHPEVKFKEISSPNNQLVMKLFKETDRLLKLLKSSV